MNSPLQTMGRLIAAALSPGRPVPVVPALTEKQWLGFVEVSNAHRLVPAIGGALKRLGPAVVVPPDLREYFGLIHEQNRIRNGLLIDQASGLIGAFNEAAIEPLLLKGIAELFCPRMPDPAMRFIGDIDLLLQESDLVRSIDVARRLGYQGKHGEMEIAPGEHHYPALRHPQQLAAVEIHRTLGRAEHLTGFDTAAVFAQSRRVESQGLRFRVLETTESATYAAYHSQLHHFPLDREIRGARHLDFLVLHLLCANEISTAEVELWFEQRGESAALQTELALIDELFGFRPQGYSPIDTECTRRARLLLLRSELKPVRRVWKTLSLLRNAFSLDRFEREVGGGSRMNLFVWRFKRLFFLARKYADPRRVAKLSRWFGSRETTGVAENARKKAKELE